MSNKDYVLIEKGDLKLLLECRLDSARLSPDEYEEQVRKISEGVDGMTYFENSGRKNPDGFSYY